MKNIKDLFKDCDLAEPDYINANIGHARNEVRKIWVCDIPNNYLEGGFALARQAIRVERRVKRDGKMTTDVVFAITSRPQQAASPEQLAIFIRGHWSIENRVHYVRDVRIREVITHLLVIAIPTGTLPFGHAQNSHCRVK